MKEALRNRWVRWTAIVVLFALRLPAGKRVDTKSYGILYEGLIAICRSLVEATGGTHSDDPGSLERIVRPWMTPRTLAQADREILESLLARCREVERELGGSKMWVRYVSRIVKVIPLAIGVL